MGLLQFAKEIAKKLGVFSFLKKGFRRFFTRKPTMPTSIEFDEFLRSKLSVTGLNAIQVGSNDGLSNDPLRRFIVEFDWRAILVEPVPELFVSGAPTPHFRHSTRSAIQRLFCFKGWILDGSYKRVVKRGAILVHRSGCVL